MEFSTGFHRFPYFFERAGSVIVQWTCTLNNSSCFAGITGYTTVFVHLKEIGTFFAFGKLLFLVRVIHPFQNPAFDIFHFSAIWLKTGPNGTVFT
jgi:hypothetical protein